MVLKEGVDGSSNTSRFKDLLLDLEAVHVLEVEKLTSELQGLRAELESESRRRGRGRPGGPPSGAGAPALGEASAPWRGAQGEAGVTVASSAADPVGTRLTFPVADEAPASPEDGLPPEPVKRSKTITIQMSLGCSHEEVPIPSADLAEGPAAAVVGATEPAPGRAEAAPAPGHAAQAAVSGAAEMELRRSRPSAAAAAAAQDVFAARAGSATPAAAAAATAAASAGREWRTVMMPTVSHIRSARGQRHLRESVRKSRSLGDINQSAYDRKYRAKQETFISLVIAANTVWMGYELTHRTSYGRPPPLARELNFAFFGLYSLDLLVRVYIEGTWFLTGRWWKANLFDSIVVALMLVEVFLPTIGLHGSSIVRAMRTLRLIRILRIVRLVEPLREFRLMCHAMLNSIWALMWVFLMTMTIAYVVGMTLTEGALPHCEANALREGQQDNPDSYLPLLCKHFGSLGMSVMTLYQATFAGRPWATLLEVLEPIGSQYSVIFVAFITFTLVVVMNTVTAIIIDITTNTVHVDKKVNIEDALKTKERYVHHMKRIFQEMDINRSGAISFDELELALRDERVHALLSRLDLEIHDMEELYHLLDKDNTGAINIEEFILGCSRLRGDAKAMDIAKVGAKLSELHRQLSEISNQQTTTLDHVDRSMPGLNSATSEGSTAQSINRKLPLRRGRVSTRYFKEAPSIPRAEERALSLLELGEVGRTIEEYCIEEGWTDPEDDTDLVASKVNLYHFCYWFICPRTVPEDIVLAGLDTHRLELNQTVRQFDGWVRAEGVVKEFLPGGGVRVHVSKGRFEGTPRIEPGDDSPGDASVPSGTESNHMNNSEDRFTVWVENRSCGQATRITAPGAMSYKELHTDKPLKPTWYCSHWWGESVLIFVHGCEAHAKARRLDTANANYWVCGYALRQYDMSSDISSDPENTAFRRAMRLAVGVLLHLDDEATPFSRIWCDFELYETIADCSKKLDIVNVATPQGGSKQEPDLLSDGRLPKESARDQTLREQTFPLALLSKGLRVRLEEGEATWPADKERILQSITGGSSETTAEVLTRANQALNARFARAAWPQAVKRRLVKDFDHAQSGTLSLPDVLRRDRALKTFDLSLEHFEEVTDNEVEAIAEGLPPNLRNVRLSFEGCANLTDQGIEALAQNIPSGLQVLKLDLLGCKAITGNGLKFLARGLPWSLVDLRLHCDGCPEIDANGLKALCKDLPKSITHFMGTFKGTKVDAIFYSVAEMKAAAGRPSTSTRWTPSSTQWPS